jgi:hypothetical protein
MNKTKIKKGALVSITTSSITEYFDIVGNPDESKQLTENDIGIVIHYMPDAFGGSWYHVLFKSLLVWAHGVSLEVIK